MENIKVVRTFNMPPETHDKLRKLAELYGSNMSAVVCALIEQEYAKMLKMEKEAEDE